MKIGNIIEYLDDGQVLIGFIKEIEVSNSGARKKESYRIVTEKNRLTNISANKIIGCEPCSISDKTDSALIAAKLVEMRERRKALAADINLGEIRELIMTESVRAWEAREIAAAYFGANVTGDEFSALSRNIFIKNQYFKRKDDYFMPATDEEVAKYAENLARENAAKAEDEAFSESVGALDKTSYEKSAVEDFIKRFGLKIEILKNSIIYPDNNSYAVKARELMQKINDILGRRLEIFDFLVKLKALGRHENLSLLKHNIKKEFSVDVNEAASALNHSINLSDYKLIDAEDFFASFLSAAPLKFASDERVDMRGLASITIDGEYTLCYDDAISYLKKSETEIALVHISDISEFITDKSRLDCEAASRSSAIYMAEGKIDLFPETISNGLFSLKEGEERFSLSLALAFDGAAIRSYAFVPSIIKVSKRCTYEEIDVVIGKLRDDAGSLKDGAAFAGGVDIAAILNLARALKKEREANGAMSVFFPKADVYVEKLDEDEPQVKLGVDSYGESSVVVSEFMICYNSLSARFLAENNIAGCFKSSKAFGDPSLIEQYREAASRSAAGYDPAYAFKIRRGMSHVETSYAISAHSMLGVSGYVQASSPVRRYTDLLMQRQVKSGVISGRASYDIETLRQKAMYAEGAQTSISEIEQESFYYWLYYCLRQNVGSEINACVVEGADERFRVELEGYYLHLMGSSRLHGRHETGERLRIVIENVDVRDRRVHFSVLKSDQI